ncbi:uncharacterized protein BXZ73DRAFT_96515 [Epithele typhae]|uniref:uncharacterized protein n=1 Tax=Epithele typhae TaxID=378194 RepID=UPI002008245F|nr:uncharacterized protein BXZ73DRAFT_96515 [Epithele typhae]KAH9944001.1 hypothetical protein BXZ73DRAFT_96515 [Epithele typhae]
MAANPAQAEEQLLDLLLTLKKTTDAEARALLNSQPQIAYALMATMVKINAVKPEVVQDILAKQGALPRSLSALPATSAPPAMPPQPPSAIPPHLQGPGVQRGAPPGPGSASLPDSLAGLPEEQKVLIQRVITMTPEEVYQLPPADRESIIKLRATLGMST